MTKYNVGVGGMPEFLAQANTIITLESWFESKEERSYVINFYDFCKYMSTHDGDSIDVSMYSRMCKIIEKLSIDELRLSKQDVVEVTNVCFCRLEYYVGALLIKSSSLYFNSDMNWKEFDVEISIPLKLKEYIGESVLVSKEDGKNMDSFFSILDVNKIRTLASSIPLLNFVMEREDFCLQDILKAEGTEFERLLSKGIMYLLYSNDNMKVRIRG